MRQFRAGAFLAIVSMLAVANPCQGVTYSVDPSAAWLGYMNVSEIPANGGGFLWGSPWGTADLAATFAGSTLTLRPNSINDPNAYWYTPEGGPGATGNKTMEANFYQEFTDVLNGQTVTFEGFVNANSFTTDHVAIAWVKDFAPDYSSFGINSVALTPGAFSVSLDTLVDAGRHVQFGFSVTGPNVWITDVGPKGFVEITSSPAAGLPGDYNEDGSVDAEDYVVWRDAEGLSTSLPNDNTAGVGSDDFQRWQAQFGSATPSLTVGAAVPEPGTWLMGAVALLGGVAIARRR